MNYARKFAFFVVLAVAIATVGIQAGLKVKVEFDKAYDFTKLRTFAWHPDGAGEIKMLELHGGDPEEIRARWEPTVKDAVEQELTKRGLVPATAGAPDLFVHYYFLVGPGSESQYRGQFIGAVPPWGLPDFAMTTTSFKLFEQGTLVLDLIDAPKRSIVWRGIAEAEVNRQRTPTERDKRIREAASDLLKKFPPKPQQK